MFDTNLTNIYCLVGMFRLQFWKPFTQPLQCGYRSSCYYPFSHWRSFWVEHMIANNSGSERKYLPREFKQTLSQELANEYFMGDKKSSSFHVHWFVTTNRFVSQYYLFKILQTLTKGGKASMCHAATVECPGTFENTSIPTNIFCIICFRSDQLVYATKIFYKKPG